MPTILYVHGTGTREPRHSQVFTLEICKTLRDIRPDLHVEACYWGGDYGAKLHAKGKSFPKYEAVRGTAYTDEQVALWEQLYRDPLYELRSLSMLADEYPNPPSKRIRERQDKFDHLVQNLHITSPLRNKLDEAGIIEIFSLAKQEVITSPIYLSALITISETIHSHQMAVARAIVAEAIQQCLSQEKYAAILNDAYLRDELVQLLIVELGGKSPKQNRVSEILFGAVSNAQAMWLDPRRRALIDASYPLAGDVLLYQQRGDEIRRRILHDITSVEPPVILLAHSLGGVACVDVLVKYSLNIHVPLLITVGSQAPFFYEINALHSLKYGNPLPPHFPLRWLNIYDELDILAFVGEEVFGSKVSDIQVKNRQPFPQVHSAYWRNKATWDAIVKELP